MPNDSECSRRMIPRRKIMSLVVFGVAVIMSGVYRYGSADGGEKALWFGAVMGALALVSAWCFHRSRFWVGFATGALSLLFVGGWFGFEALVQKGWQESEIRQLLILALTLVTTLILLLPSKNRPGEGA